MTTTVGIKFDKGVVLGTDQRATMGHFIATNEATKLAQLAPHIGLTLAGSCGDAQILIRYLKVEAKDYELRNGRRIPVEALATYTSNILHNAGGGLEVHLLIGGVDETGTRLFSFDSIGAIEESPFASTGSGSPGALGLIEDAMVQIDAPLEEAGAIEVAVRAIKSAMKRDAASGGAADVMIFTAEGLKHVRTTD